MAQRGGQTNKRTDGRMNGKSSHSTGLGAAAQKGDRLTERQKDRQTSIYNGHPQLECAPGLAQGCSGRASLSVSDFTHRTTGDLLRIGSLVEINDFSVSVFGDTHLQMTGDRRSEMSKKLENKVDRPANSRERWAGELIDGRTDQPTDGKTLI